MRARRSAELTSFLRIMSRLARSVDTVPTTAEPRVVADVGETSTLAAAAANPGANTVVVVVAASSLLPSAISPVVSVAAALPGSTALTVFTGSGRLALLGRGEAAAGSRPSDIEISWTLFTRCLNNNGVQMQRVRKVISNFIRYVQERYC